MRGLLAVLPRALADGDGRDQGSQRGENVVEGAAGEDAKRKGAADLERRTIV